MEGLIEAGVTQLRAVPGDAAHSAAPTHVSAAPAGPIGVSRMGVGLGSRQQIEAELDDMAADIREFYRYDPDQVLRKTAAYAARLTELTVLLHRVEALDRQYVRVRTMQVEKWVEELDRQFKIASRLIEVQRQDLAMLRGNEG